MDHPGSESQGKFHGAIVRTVVGHDDLAGDTHGFKGAEGFFDTDSNGSFLVQTGHDRGDSNAIGFQAFGTDGLH
jgi:hypothetical protein